MIYLYSQLNFFKSVQFLCICRLPCKITSNHWAGQRDRRLEVREIVLGEKTYQTEEGAIRSVLADKNETLLFDMALETAMRLREMYTLKVGANRYHCPHNTLRAYGEAPSL